MDTVRLNEFVNGRRLNWFDLNVLLWTFLALFADGYDITVVAFAAPEMTRQWHIGAGALGPVMSASMVGVFFGAPIFGIIGDRWGRRTGIATGCVVFGLTMLAVAGTHDLWQMTLWRLIGGMGIGGVMPNATALVAELTPTRRRAALIILMFMGAFVGSAAPSIVIACVPPGQSIPMLFLLGGAIPIIIAVGATLFLPESVKFLATKARDRLRLLRTLQRMRPDVLIPDGTIIVDEPSDRAKSQGIVAALFGQDFAWVTLLLWASFICSLATMYYLSNWLPLMLERHAIASGDAVRITALYQLGGGAGTLLISAFVDRFGFLLITALFLTSVPVIALMGAPGQSLSFVTSMSVLAGFLGQSVQIALNAGAGLLYPSAVRSKAVGWAFAIGRIGSVAGPMLGGLAFELNLSFPVLFIIPAIPMALGGLTSGVLTGLLVRKTGSFRMCESISGSMPGNQRAVIESTSRDVAL